MHFKNKVFCKICGASVFRLGQHLLYSHKNITYREYYDKYIDPLDHLCKCGKPLKFRNLIFGYSITCGDSRCIYELQKKGCLEKTGFDCSWKNPKTIKKSKQTKLEKYNDENYTNREKFKQTCLEKYNVDNIRKTEFFKKQSKKTKKEKYSKENYNNREKANETYFKKTGYKHNSYNPEVVQKRKKTNLEKHGDENYNKDSVFPGHIGIKSQKFFIELDRRLQEQNVKYDRIDYGISENGKHIKKERFVMVKDISKIAKARFLDCYIEIDKRQINFEFDESFHEKKIEEDLIREQEILIKKPKLEIYRIKEKYFDENIDQVLNDLVEIVKNKNAKTFYDYSSLINLD